MRTNNGRKGRALIIVMMVVFAGTFCVSAFMAGKLLKTGYEEQAAFDELSALVNERSSMIEDGLQDDQTIPVQVGMQAISQPDAADGNRFDESTIDETLPTETEAMSESLAQTDSVADEKTIRGDQDEQIDSIEIASRDTAAEAREETIRVPVENPPVPLPKYEKLYEKNPDFFGWIAIDDTMIDYPVMNTPEDPEYYLQRGFDRNRSASGTPFLGANCREEGRYYIVYAHNMKNGTMFGTLSRYADRAYWEKHPIIQFDTLYEERVYQVVAAFNSKVYGKNEVGVFRYYDYTDLSAARVFEEYMRGVRAAALYDTGISVEYGDEILALSTCNYHTDNGRFVVVAKRIPQVK